MNPDENGFSFVSGGSVRRSWGGRGTVVAPWGAGCRCPRGRAGPVPSSTWAERRGGFLLTFPAPPPHSTLIPTWVPPTVLKADKMHQVHCCKRGLHSFKSVCFFLF